MGVIIRHGEAWLGGVGHGEVWLSWLRQGEVWWVEVRDYCNHKIEVWLGLIWFGVVG